MTDYVAPRRLDASSYFVCFSGIVWREVLRFLHQRERFLAALVRPLVWLFIFAAGFRQTLGVSIIPPYETYVLYEVFVTPGLVGLILLFNAMLTSLTMVYDRETGAMRTLLVSPFPRSFLLISKLLGGVAVCLLQVYAFLLIAYFWEIEPPLIGYLTVLPALVRTGAVHVVGHQAARELRRSHEFRDLPDVLRLIGAVPALAHQGIEPAALRDLPRQPVHARRRTDPVRALWPV
jgi:alcohol ABC transporter permease protein